MYKEINFFASLPRSGSTLLASIMYGYNGSAWKQLDN